MKDRIWLKVTSDDYQLPMCVADSANELAEMCGDVTAQAIREYAAHYKSGYVKTPKYIYIQLKEVEEDEDDTEASR